MARSFGAAPNPTGFGDPSAQAGALRKRVPQPANVDGGRLRVERSANDRARLSKEIKKPRSVIRSGALPFQQRTNTSCYLAIPTHGFTVVLSVFMGTPPAKPL